MSKIENKLQKACKNYFFYFNLKKKDDTTNYRDHWEEWWTKARWPLGTLSGPSRTQWKVTEPSRGWGKQWWGTGLFWVLVISPWHDILMKATQGRTLISAHNPGHRIRPGGEGTVAGGVGGSQSPSIHNLGAREMNAGSASSLLLFMTSRAPAQEMMHHSTSVYLTKSFMSTLVSQWV